MPEREFVDFYELLQISPSAEPDTIHRVYRLLAQRWHPDNPQTGNITHFRAIHEAYVALQNPETRAQYDVQYQARRQSRWHITPDARPTGAFEMEQVVRLTILEILYSHRRANTNNPGIFILDLEELVGSAREHLEFTMWYLQQKHFVQRTENSRMAITAEGVDHLENNYQQNGYRRRLAASNAA